MKNFRPNHYERAFGNFLIDNRIQYIAVDEKKRAALGKSNIKSFDYLLYPRNQQIIIAEIKGRRFKGTSLAKLAGFECWVTADDVEGLTNWQQTFSSGHTAVFIFAYRIEKVDVDFDGRETYEFDGNKYIFFAVPLDDYRKAMVLRSPKWRTVTLPADKFRQYAVQLQNLLF
jgi:hypothetical protein